MLTCPSCHTLLSSRKTATGIFWVCDHCGGRAMGLALLRKIVGDQLVAQAWSAALRQPTSSGRGCAVCAKDMLQVVVGAGDSQLVLDLCRRCEFMWFDADEFESIPPLPPKPKPLGEIDRSMMSLEQREKLAMEKAKMIANREQVEQEPDNEWKMLPAFFGFPVEMDSTPIQRQPWLTYSVSAVIAAVSCVAFFHLSAMVQKYGLIPADVWKRHGLTLFTSFFLHGSVLHLVGNLYFLVTFGRAVEDFLGRMRWLILLVSAALIGDFAHIALGPDNLLPCIGASGGISGILAFYTLKFPHARIGLMLRFGFFFRWVPMSAWVAFGLWILLQSWGAYAQRAGISHVSSLAHLGGVIAGVILWWAWRDLDAKPALDAGLVKVLR